MLWTHHKPHNVMLMTIFCSVKNSSISHVVEGHAAAGVPQVSGSGDPLVTSAGMFARCNHPHFEGIGQPACQKSFAGTVS